MVYDITPTKAPRFTGLPLRLVVALAEGGSPTSMLARTLLASAGVDDLRQVPATGSPMFRPPLANPAPVLGPAPDLGAILRRGPDTSMETVADFSSAYRAGRTTPEDVAERAIEAITRSDLGDRPLRIFIAHDPDDVRRQACEAGERLRAGRPLSVLDGVPVAVKDELHQQGYPTTVGTRFHGKEKAGADAEVVARLRAAGAVLLGKTNMHEIGIGVTGLNANHGACRNPWDPGRVTGGSSSGSAAAVAAGLCPIAIGADGGGSIRIPASFCGVVGLKPTFGRCSEHGVFSLCWSVGHVGPIASTVRDCVLAYALMGGPDPRDEVTLPQPPLTLEGLENGDLHGVRVGVFRPWFEDADAAVVDACRGALDRLVSAGAALVEIDIPELRLIRTIHLITIVSEMVASQVQWYGAHHKDFGLDTRMTLALGRCLTASDWVHAQRHRTRLGQVWSGIYEQVDVIATPTTACTAPPYKADALPYGESDLPLTVRIMRYAQAGNLFGLPALSMPVGFDGDGLPIGFQLMGRAWEEALLLRLGLVLEAGNPRKRAGLAARLLG